MTDLGREGIRMLFVSHNMGAIAGTCKRALLLRQGRVVMVGDVGQVIEAYIPKATSGNACVNFGEGSRFPGCFLEASLDNESGEQTSQFDITEGVNIRNRDGVNEPLSTFVL